MNIEKYTDRARGFVQSAQSLALREGHRTPSFDDDFHRLHARRPHPEGRAGLLERRTKMKACAERLHTVQ